MSVEIGKLREENRKLRARVAVLEAQVKEPVPRGVLDDWSLLLADFLWWFRGFEASATKRQRTTVPDTARLRELREDLHRMGEGKELLASIRRDVELPF